MPATHRVLVAALLVTCGVMLPLRRVESQTQRQIAANPDQLLEGFLIDYEREGPLPPTAGMDLSAVVLKRADYPPSSLKAVLDGLEEIALSKRSPRVRARAVLFLASSASEAARQAQPGIVARLARIYAQSANAEVRAAVITGLARSVDHQSALAFLERVARTQPEDFPGGTQTALTAIASHADAGTGTLRRLHETKAVKEPNARQWLEREAERGFRAQ